MANYVRIDEQRKMFLWSEVAAVSRSTDDLTVIHLKSGGQIKLDCTYASVADAFENYLAGKRSSSSLGMAGE